MEPFPSVNGFCQLKQTSKFDSWYSSMEHILWVRQDVLFVHRPKNKKAAYRRHLVRSVSELLFGNLRRHDLAMLSFCILTLKKTLLCCSGHRFEDNPGVRRHLVKKSSRCQMTRASNSSTPLSSLKKKKRAADKKTHEVCSTLLPPTLICILTKGWINMKT